MKYLALITALACIAGCAHTEREWAAPEPPDALVAIDGNPLVFAEPSLSLMPAGAVDATLAGRAVPAWVDHVTPRARGVAGDRWRSLPPRWESVEPGAAGALTFVHVEIPPGAPSGELRVGGERLHLRVLSNERPTSPPSPPGDPSLTSAEDATTNDYWRLRLIGASASGLADRHPSERAAALALAAQWDAALALLERASPWLGGRTVRALTRTCNVAGAQAPAWLDDPATDDRLRRTLLDPRATPAERAETARAWLDAQPSMIARVRDPASAGVTAVQITDLSGNPARAYISDGRREGAAQLLPPWGSVEAPAPVTSGARDLLIASAGARALDLASPITDLVAQPPGARIGPLLPSLSMAHWLEGATAPVDAATAAAALLQRRAHTNEWELYVECKSPVPTTADRVLVLLGPRGGVGETLILEHTGLLVSDTDGSAAKLVDHGVREDRWWATIAIPASAIAPDGTLLIGLTRRLGEGDRARRWAWPVALLPWEVDPGRVSVTLTDWYRLSR